MTDASAVSAKPVAKPSEAQWENEGGAVAVLPVKPGSTAPVPRIVVDARSPATGKPLPA